MIEVIETDAATTFCIRVVPRASKTEIAGTVNGVLKVRVASPPADGAANAELIKFFAKTLGVPKSSVEIVAGETARAKRIRITGVTAERLRNAIY